MEDSVSFVTEHIPALKRYARALTRHRTDVDADDLVQECLLRALSRARPWNYVRNVPAYLFTILHNVHVDTVSKRANGSATVPIEDMSWQIACDPAQDSCLGLRDLDDALSKLSEDQRSVILLVGLEGLSYREAAEILGVPIGTIMSRLSRGREALRQLMEGRAATRGAIAGPGRNDRRPEPELGMPIHNKLKTEGVR